MSTDAAEAMAEVLERVRDRMDYESNPKEIRRLAAEALRLHESQKQGEERTVFRCIDCHEDTPCFVEVPGWSEEDDRIPTSCAFEHEPDNPKKWIRLGKTVEPAREQGREEKHAGVLFRSAISGLWYTDIRAAGTVSAVRIDGNDLIPNLRPGMVWVDEERLWEFTDRCGWCPLLARCKAEKEKVTEWDGDMNKWCRDKVLAYLQRKGGGEE